MKNYPKQLAKLSEKELAELNFTALLHLHLRINRMEGCLEHLSKQSGYEYHNIDKKPVLHLADMFKKIDELLGTLETTIASDIADGKK